MSKPRFPLSVSRTFMYRAYLPVSGEIIECDTLKELYYAIRKNLRAETRHNLKIGEYRYAEAQMSFGYLVEYEDKPGYYYCEWHSVHNFGALQISSVSEWFYSTADESNHEIRTM